MKAYCVIPARRAATRLPDKPLLDCGGLPLVLRTAGAALRCRSFRRVVVSTDCYEVAAAVRGHLLMADGLRLYYHVDTAEYACGTDRVAACVARSAIFNDAEIVVNLQCDEPEISPEALSLLVLRVEAGAEMATLVADRDPTDGEYASEDCVLALAPGGVAASFCRGTPILKNQPWPWRPHVGAYAFRREALARFASRAPTEPEKERRLEQLRAFATTPPLEIAAVLAPHPGRGINTPADLDAYRERLSTKS